METKAHTRQSRSTEAFIPKANKMKTKNKIHNSATIDNESRRVNSLYQQQTK
jgi:hypothetical protein